MPFSFASGQDLPDETVPAAFINSTRLVSDLSVDPALEATVLAELN
jgi:hypothetical protein